VSEFDAGVESTGNAADDQPDDGREATPPEPTGVRAADEARAGLAQLDGMSVEDQVEVYEDLHRGLQEGLADLDER
jgi:hypothetical protein